MDLVTGQKGVIVIRFGQISKSGFRLLFVFFIFEDGGESVSVDLSVITIYIKLIHRLQYIHTTNYKGRN